jgi:hypothetical protein
MDQPPLRTAPQAPFLAPRVPGDGPIVGFTAFGTMAFALRRERGRVVPYLLVPQAGAWIEQPVH